MINFLYIFVPKAQYRIRFGNDNQTSLLPLRSPFTIFVGKMERVENPMNFVSIKENKKRYLELLLLADEQESMVDRYLERGEMYAMEEDGETVAVAVVTEELLGVYELKNIAVSPSWQKKGYGKRMLDFIEGRYRRAGGRSLLVGTGDSPQTVGFYEHCGFSYSHRVVGFFTQNYDHPIVEDGKLLVDMLYFRKEL